jgi:hypothetical protein
VKTMASFRESTPSDKIIRFFDDRKRMVHDLSISGWMVSPIPGNMEDDCANHLGMHWNVVKSLLKKWYGYEVRNIYFLPVLVLKITS